MFISENLNLFGALISNISKYENRKWELKQINTIDIFGAIITHIKLFIKGNDIYKVIPKIDYSSNEDFIMDNIRLFFFKYNNQRISNPMLRFNLKYINISWKISTIFIKLNFNFLNLCKKLKWGYNLIGFSDTIQSRESLYFFKYFINKIGFSNFSLMNYKNKFNFFFDYRQNIFLKYNKHEKYDVFFFLGINLRMESPIFNLIIKNNRNTKFIFNFLLNNFFKNKTSIFLGNNFFIFSKFMQGTNIYSKNFLKYKNPLFFFSYNFINQFKDISFFYFCFNFFFINFCNFFFPNIIFYNSLDIGLFNRINSLNNFYLLKKNFNLNFFFNNRIQKFKKINNLNIKKLKLKINNYVIKGINIFQGNNVYKNIKNIFNLILPSKTFYETNSKFLDSFGFYIQSNSIGLQYKTSLDSLNIFLMFLYFLFPFFSFFNVLKTFNFFNHSFLNTKTNSINRFYIKKSILVEENSLISTKYSNLVIFLNFSNNVLEFFVGLPLSNLYLVINNKFKNIQ
jgi:hypothetical protein